MMASGYRGTIYTGATSGLIGRVQQHRDGTFEGFTKKYGVNRLVWYETADTMEPVIATERKLKKWRREWKVALIEEKNPHWVDLATGLGLPPLEN